MIIHHKLIFKGLLVFLLLGYNLAFAANPVALKVGETLPEIQLKDQDGNDFSFEHFRGKAVVLTFIFSRCPVPDFCPMMSANFKALQKAIREEPALADKVQLVSISIDPEFDTPEVLKRYADHFALDTQDWSFVTGDLKKINALAAAFSVYIDASSGESIDHTLSTSISGPDGKIKKIWRDNQWTPKMAIEELNLILQ